MSADRHLVIFVKAPRLGRVKRRLAADIGAVAALMFYRRTAGKVVRRLSRDTRWRTWLAVTPDSAIQGGSWPAGGTRIPQGVGDLGQRMFRPMRRLPPGPVVIVGTDIPELDSRHIAAAFAALGRHDAVFGPAPDGGYWLVGLARRARRRDVFRQVRWSTRHALADTLANLPSTWSVKFLTPLEDVDDGVSFLRWRQRAREAAALARGAMA